MINRRLACSALAGATLFALGRTAGTGDAAVRIVIPAVGSGGTDILARLIAGELERQWRRPVTVENMPGAAGGIAARAVMRAAPDGSTLLMGSTGTLMAAASGADGRLPATYRVTEQFAPIVLVAAPPYVVTLHPSVPARTVAELIGLARARQAEGRPLRYGSSGSGAASHLTAVLFEKEAEVVLQHVPLLGTGAAIEELLTGRIDLLFGPPQTVRDSIAAGRLIAVATTGPERSPAFPDVPTVAESGLPGFESVGWFGLLAPRDTPARTVEGIAADVAALLGRPELRARLARLGATAQPSTPAAFAAFIDADVAKWSRLLAATGGLRIDSLPR